MENQLEGHWILLMRLGGFGDVVFTLPAVHLVRKSFPKARVAFLVYKEFASLLEGFPGIDAVLTLDRERYRRLNPLEICAETFSLLRALVRSRFRLVVDFQGFGETGLLAWLSGAPQRWGSVYRPARAWAYTGPVRRNPRLHPIEYHLEVVSVGGGLRPGKICNEFVPPPGAIEEARRFLRGQDLRPDQPMLFIQPFTSNPQKDWPLQHYLAAARHWREQGMQVLFGGGPRERAALEPARAAGFAVAAGAPALLSASLAQLSRVVLGGDTGLLHLAVALGRRVVMLMQSVQPGACYPFGHPEWALLPPDGSPVAAITPEAVNRACAQALAESAAVTG